MEARWLSVDEIMDIFSQHNLYADTDEMRRGMYLREYTALRGITEMRTHKIPDVYYAGGKRL